MPAQDRLITFDNVSKFYGEALGVNRVTLALEPGITSIVGPHGAGKTTLMNLMTGLLRPTRGQIRVLGIPSSESERLFQRCIEPRSLFDELPVHRRLGVNHGFGSLQNIGRFDLLNAGMNFRLRFIL